MYYIHDLEADKLQIHTGGKANWLKLPDDVRNHIKRFCIFSRSEECWLTKSNGKPWWFNQLAGWGFEDHGTTGEKLSFAERIEAKQERAEARAGRYEARSDRADRESNAAAKRSYDMMSVIPMGQPILVGHYSEQRDRNYRDRAWNLMGKSVELSDKAKHYADRAATARSTAEGAQYSNPRYLGNRIKELTAERSLILRRLEGKYYHYDQPKEISDEARTRYEEALSNVNEKLDFFEHCLATCGQAIYNRESLKAMKATVVKIRGRWEKIIRLNPTTVAVPNICYQTVESQEKWPLKYPYTDVQDARAAEVSSEVS